MSVGTAKKSTVTVEPTWFLRIDGLQALHLAIKCATAVVTSAKPELEWFGHKGDLMLPKFLPDLPKRQQDRLETIVEREAVKFWKGLERAHKTKLSSKLKARRRAKAADKT